MTDYNYFKITIINKAGIPLYVECDNCGTEERKNFTVKRRATLRRPVDRYQFKLYYDCRSLVLETRGSNMIEADKIPAPCNPGFQGKLVVINYAEKAVRITCNEVLSVSNIIEGAHLK